MGKLRERLHYFGQEMTFKLIVLPKFLSPYDQTYSLNHISKNEYHNKLYDLQRPFRLVASYSAIPPDHSAALLALWVFTNCICTSWGTGECSLYSIVNSPFPCTESIVRIKQLYIIQTKIKQMGESQMPRLWIDFMPHLCHWTKSCWVPKHIVQWDLERCKRKFSYLEKRA